MLAAGDKSATELARVMGISQPAASYHVRMLADAGLVAQTTTRHLRGGREKIYGVATAEKAPVAGMVPVDVVTAAVDALQNLIA